MLIWLAIVLAVNIGHDLMYGPQAAYFSELFGTRMRYTGASVGYQLASVFAGGFAPLIAVALLAAGGGEPYLVALYMMGMGLITVVATHFARETYQDGHRASCDAELRARTERFVRKPRTADRETSGVAVTHETVFTLEATPIKFGPGRVRRRGLGAQAPRRLAGDGGQRSRRGRAPGSPSRVRGGDRGGGDRGRVVFDRARVEPTAESLQEAADFAVDGELRRLRRRRRRARASTPPRSPTSSPPTRRRSWTTSTRRSAGAASRPAR